MTEIVKRVRPDEVQWDAESITDFLQSQDIPRFYTVVHFLIVNQRNVILHGKIWALDLMGHWQLREMESSELEQYKKKYDERTTS